MPAECNLQLMDTAQKTASELMHTLKTRSVTLALSESCTAGLVSALLAEIPGASSVLWGSFVCYTIEAKAAMLGLDRDKLLADGLVSRETASSMAIAALEKSGADIAAAVTGLAGPHGDGSNVPVGTVWVAAAQAKSITVKEFHLTGSRNDVRLQAAIAVLETIKSLI